MSDRERNRKSDDTLATGIDQRAGRSVRNALHAYARARSIPLTASLELTKRCNLHCYHCYVAGECFELSTARWLELVDELEAEGCMQISLTGGELTLRDDWLAIAERVKQRRMTLTVLTNGTLMDDADIARLVSLRAFRVSVSVYGGSAEPHDRVTGVAGSFERSVATVRRLRERGVRCRLACTLMPDTLPEVPRIVELAAGLDCEYQFDPTVTPKSDGDDSVLTHRLPAERVREVFLSGRMLEKTREGRLAVHPGDLPAREMSNCGAGVASLHIEANGDVLPCIGLRPAFGNVAMESFHEVWHSAAAGQHRAAMRQPLADCAACELSVLCTVRCPRLAAHETGSVSGKSQRACDLAAINAELRLAVLALQARHEW